MPEIKVNLDPETHKKLKEYAKEDERSLTKYIERGLKFLAEYPYHLQLHHHGAGTVVVPAGIPEQPYKITAQTLDMNSLPEGMTIKYTKPQTPAQAQLSPEEEELKHQKVLLQQDKIRQQRVKYLVNKCEEILGYVLPYLEENNQSTIDFVLNKYPTNQDIDTYLLKLKQEDDEDEEQKNVEKTSHSDEYIKIKNYFDRYCDSYDFNDMVSNAKQGDLQYLKDYYDIKLHDALGSPHSYDFSDEQWQELIKIITE